MFIKSLLAVVFAAAFIAPASASVVYNIDETFASGAVFKGALTFTDDLHYLAAVDGELSGDDYGSKHINWLWWSGANGFNNGSTGANFLMSGAWPGYDAFINFSWDFSNGPALSLSNGGYGNYVDGFDASTGGTLTAAAAVPEPGSIALLSLGLLGVATSRRKSANRRNA